MSECSRSPSTASYTMDFELTERLTHMRIWADHRSSAYTGVIIDNLVISSLAPSEQDPCQAGYTRCGLECVDLRTDASNCGGCGNVCSALHNCCTSGECGCEGVSDCGTGASCVDIPAPGTGFTCECGAGLSGSAANAAATCVDIDGCEGVSDCGSGACFDIPAPGAGFTCECGAGLTGSTTNAAATCVDTDGCEGVSDCGTGASSYCCCQF